MLTLFIFAIIVNLICLGLLRLFHQPRGRIHGPIGLWGIAVTPDLGHGAAITFQSGIMANLTSIEWVGMNRAAVETTTLSTSGGKTFMPGDNYDPGELHVEGWFDSDSAYITALTAAAETVTLTFADAETAAASGFMTEFGITDITNEGVMKFEATIKLTGTITP